MSDRKPQDEREAEKAESEKNTAPREAVEASSAPKKVDDVEDDAAHDADDADDTDDSLDLDDLDAMGVDGVVAGLRSEGDDEDAAGSSRPPRPPWVSAVVLAFSVYLLVTMFSDFWYWVRPGEPEDLGHASDWVQDARVPEGWHNHYVELEGTPDVRNAALLKTDEGNISYLRVTEGDGSLFAAVPRSKDVDPGLTFPGRYEGRMVRLGSDRAFPWLAQFYADNDITRSVDIEASALLQALRAGGDGSLEVESHEGPVTIAPSHEIRLVVGQPDARVQLGVESFPDPEAAKALVESLQMPFREDETRAGFFHQFIVRIPPEQRDAVAEKLVADLEEEPDPADPKEGASVLPMTATYLVPVSDLEASADGLQFVLPENSPGPGYTVQDGRLVERDLAGGPMTVALQDVSAVRFEKPITVDPDGYLIVAGADPGTERTIAIAWLVVLGIALANAAALGLAWRRRRR